MTYTFGHLHQMCLNEKVANNKEGMNITCHGSQKWIFANSTACEDLKPSMIIYGRKLCRYCRKKDFLKFYRAY